jgi:hypothetical protein
LSEAQVTGLRGDGKVARAIFRMSVMVKGRDLDAAHWVGA